MEKEEKIEWSALEYEEKERSNDWFWALGVIAVAGSIASIIFANYFFALLLIIALILLGFFAIKKPEVITYEVNEKGLKILDRLYPYKGIKSFWVQKRSSDAGTENQPMLFIKTTRIVMPVMSIPIEDIHADGIKGMLLSYNIPEEEMHEHPSIKIMDSLGF